MHLSIEDQVPADRLLVYGFSLLINESSLIGESEPIDVNVNKEKPFYYQNPNSRKICKGW